MPSNPQDRLKKSKRKNPKFTQPIPTVEDPMSKYAPNAWAAGGNSGMEDLLCPSGQLCLVRRPGIEGLMKANVLHSIDSLSQIVSAKHLKKGSNKEVDAHSILQDPQALEQVTTVVDKVISHCVVKPEIHLAPNDVTLRKPGVVYSDMVDLTDKMFIFNYVVGGTRDLETFRGGLDESLGGMEDVEGVLDDAQ